MRKKITEEEWIVLETEHLKNKMSLIDISKKLNINYRTLYYGFKRRNIEITLYDVNRRKYDVNDNFFQSIDTEDKAYILGILLADGYIHKGNTVCIKLKEEDILTIEYIKSMLCPTKPIFNDKSIRGDKVFKAKKLEVCSEQLCKDLKKLGMVPRKTGIEKFPLLREDMYPHFVRGFFDGDGSVSKKSNMGPAKSYQFYICCTNKQFLRDMRNKLNFGKVYTEKRPTVDMHTLKFTNVKECLSLVKYMYQDCKSHYMKRKAIKCIDYANTVLRHNSSVQCNA